MEVIKIEPRMSVKLILRPIILSSHTRHYAQWNFHKNKAQNWVIIRLPYFSLFLNELLSTNK